jgi:hypothetical protein
MSPSRGEEKKKYIGNKSMAGKTTRRRQEETTRGREKKRVQERQKNEVRKR